jgi:hypothetical protein
MVPMPFWDNTIHGMQGKSLGCVLGCGILLERALYDEESYAPITLVCHYWGTIITVGVLHCIFNGTVEGRDFVLGQHQLWLVTMVGSLNRVVSSQHCNVAVRGVQLAVQDWLLQSTNKH